MADDSFLQPSPGTSAADHLAGSLVPLTVLALAAIAFPRIRVGGQAALALLTGFLGLVASSEALYYSSNAGPSGDDFTGLLCSPRRPRPRRHRCSCCSLGFSYVVTHAARGFVPAADLGVER